MLTYFILIPFDSSLFQFQSYCNYSHPFMSILAIPISILAFLIPNSNSKWFNLIRPSFKLGPRSNPSPSSLIKSMVQIKPPKPSYSKEKTLNPNILLYSLLSTLAAASQLSSPSFRRKLPPLAGGSCFSLPLLPLSSIFRQGREHRRNQQLRQQPGDRLLSLLAPSSSSNQQLWRTATSSSQQLQRAAASSSSNQPPGETTTSSSSSQWEQPATSELRRQQHGPATNINSNSGKQAVQRLWN